MDLTNYEIEIINMLFDNIFSIEKRKELLLKCDSSLYLEFALNGDNQEIIYEMFNNAFKLEDKIKLIIALYNKYDFAFENIHELIKNRNVLIFNHYNSNWRKKKISRFNRYCA